MGQHAAAGQNGHCGMCVAFAGPCMSCTAPPCHPGHKLFTMPSASHQSGFRNYLLIHMCNHAKGQSSRTAPTDQVPARPQPGPRRRPRASRKSTSPRCRRALGTRWTRPLMLSGRSTGWVWTVETKRGTRRRRTALRTKSGESLRGGASDFAPVCCQVRRIPIRRCPWLHDAFL